MAQPHAAGVKYSIPLAGKALLANALRVMLWIVPLKSLSTYVTRL